MNISDFDYTLPTKLIAKHPPKVRGQARLIVLDRASGSIKHKAYADFIDYLQHGDVLVINKTKVIKARLLVKNSDGQERELLLVEKHGKRDDWHHHKAIYRGKIRNNETLSLHSHKIKVKEILDGGVALIQSTEDLLILAERYGSVPLPPYMNREPTKDDVERYQTTFADQPGSVAAPTASLNLTRTMLSKLQSKGVIICYLTLHVGLGTFMPIRTGKLEQHIMHKEYFEIPETTIRTVQQAKKADQKVFALGTTVTRTLEYAAEKILDEKPKNLSGEADIFIYQGYEFKVIDGLLTNFHAPKSTVLMMAAAFAGWKNLQTAYSEAITKEYALLSYGDSMLIT